MSAIETFPNYIIIYPSERKLTNVYKIVFGIQHIFPFSIAPIVGLKIMVEQLAAGMQDGSLTMWLSKIPFDQEMFTQYDCLNPVVILKKISRQITIWDQNRIDIPSGALALDPNITYFINIKNNQVKTNVYKLVII